MSTYFNAALEKGRSAYETVKNHSKTQEVVKQTQELYQIVKNHPRTQEAAAKALVLYKQGVTAVKSRLVQESPASKAAKQFDLLRTPESFAKEVQKRETHINSEMERIQKRIAILDGANSNGVLDAAWKMGEYKQDFAEYNNFKAERDQLGQDLNTLASRKGKVAEEAKAELENAQKTLIESAQIRGTEWTRTAHAAAAVGATLLIYASVNYFRTTCPECPEFAPCLPPPSSLLDNCSSIILS